MFPDSRTAMSEPRHDYRIDYDAPDVVDLMRQIRSRTGREAGVDPLLPDPDGDARSRVRDYLELDETRPHAIQEELGLGGAWNVTPEDLRTAGDGPAGRLVRASRSLLRPLVKLFANLELPLYKQFKVNLGTASALRDLLEENASLRRRVGELERRLESIESRAEADES